MRGTQKMNSSRHARLRFVFAAGLLMPMCAAQVLGGSLQSKEAAGSATTTPSRPCKTADAENPGKKKPGKRTAAVPVASEPGCLEARATAIEVQEYLQNYVRRQGWNLTNERVAEASWTFYIGLEKEELSKYAKVDTGAEEVAWTGGQAYVQAETSELGDGYTRLRVKVRVEGHGQRQDRFAPQKKSWDLDSNGALEAKLTTALATHMTSKE